MNVRLALDAYRRLVTAKRIAILCHFDPALCDRDGIPSQAAREALEVLHGVGDAEIIIISERSLDDLMERAGLLGVTYAGSYGLQMQVEGQRIEPANAGAIRARMSGLALELEKQLSETPIEIENWELCLSVTWGGAQEAALLARTAVQDAIEGEDAFSLTPRQDRLLVLPQGYGSTSLIVKGALQLVKNPEETVILYMGGDINDEDTFESIRKEGGVTVCVGDAHRSSRAEHRLKNVDVAGLFLSALAEIRSPYPE